MLLQYKTATGHPVAEHQKIYRYDFFRNFYPGVTLSADFLH
jgi:hypothetical protein